MVASDESQDRGEGGEMGKGSCQVVCGLHLLAFATQPMPPDGPGYPLTSHSVLGKDHALLSESCASPL